MIKTEDVEKLAKLARIEITDDEKKQFQKEIGAILDYVSELKEAPTDNSKSLTRPENMNRLREDKSPHAPGTYTKELLEGAPRSEKGFVKVKKIFE